MFHFLQTLLRASDQKPLRNRWSALCSSLVTVVCSTCVIVKEVLACSSGKPLPPGGSSRVPGWWGPGGGFPSTRGWSFWVPRRFLQLVTGPQPPVAPQPPSHLPGRCWVPHLFWSPIQGRGLGAVSSCWHCGFSRAGENTFTMPTVCLCPVCKCQGWWPQHADHTFCKVTE